MKVVRRLFPALYLLIGLGAALFGQTIISVSVPGGIYSDDQQLELAMEGRGELYYSFAESRDQRFISYLFPFTLSALPGEERMYTLRVEARSGDEVVKKKEFGYVIDKRPPGVPAVSVDSGRYGSDISVIFAGESREFIIYCIDGNIQDQGKRWQGERLEFGARA